MQIRRPLQSESVLDCIVSTNTLQSCKPQSAITAIHCKLPSCRLQSTYTAECTLPYCIILKVWDFPATGRHTAPNPGNLLAPHSLTSS